MSRNSIKFAIPIQLSLSGPTQESLNLEMFFLHKGFSCVLQFGGDTVMSVTDESVREATRLEILVSDSRQEFLRQLIDGNKHNELVTLCQSVANRCLRAIRNFGVVPELHELHDAHINSQVVLASWNTEYLVDGEGWKPLIDTPEIKLLRAIGALNIVTDRTAAQNTPLLETNNWGEIQEAIEDDLPPTPEREFTINALQHLRSKNFRLALVESIIGLEIVLTRFIREYLHRYKGTPEKRIDNFLSPGFGLTARIAGILDLTLEEHDLRKIDFQKVFSAIKLRNTITHKTGHIPTGVPEASLREAITAVITLSDVLARRIFQAAALPEIQKISDDLYDKHKSRRPSIVLLGRHKVRAAFGFIPGVEVPPTADEIEPLVTDLVEKLKERDRRFRPEQHLTVSFFELPDHLIATWREGKLKFAKQ